MKFGQHLLSVAAISLIALPVLADYQSNSWQEPSPQEHRSIVDQHRANMKRLGEEVLASMGSPTSEPSITVSPQADIFAKALLAFQGNNDFLTDPVGSIIPITQSELNQLVQVIEHLEMKELELRKVLNTLNGTGLHSDSRKWLLKLINSSKDMAEYIKIRELLGNGGECVYSYGASYKEAIERLQITPSGIDHKAYASEELRRQWDSGRFTLAQCYCKGRGCSSEPIFHLLNR